MQLISCSLFQPEFLTILSFNFVIQYLEHQQLTKREIVKMHVGGKVILESRVE